MILNNVRMMLHVMYVVRTSESVNVPSGDTGVTGVKGKRGNGGEDGSQGPTGGQGPTGDQGLQGPVGEKGVVGEQGTTPAADKGQTVSTWLLLPIFLLLNPCINRTTIWLIFVH